jgi:hypothetical protein
MKKISKIQKNRQDRYKNLIKMGYPDTVYTRDDNKIFGFIVGEAEPYMGKTGWSSRVKELWPDGKITVRCYSGMRLFRSGWKIV